MKKHGLGINSLLSREFLLWHGKSSNCVGCGFGHGNNCMKIMPNSIPDAKTCQTLHASKAQEMRLFFVCNHPDGCNVNENMTPRSPMISLPGGGVTSIGG